MGVNKVIVNTPEGERTIVDLTGASVTPETLAKGETAYDKTGEKITGTMEAAVDPVLQEKTVSPSTSAQTVTPDSGYDGLSKVNVNAVPKASLLTDIQVSPTGKITAETACTEGYIEKDIVITTKQLTTQAAQTITPGTTDKTIASGRYLTGTQTIKGDANLLPENIVSGKTIFGVAGTAETGGGGSEGGGSGSLETCTVIVTKDDAYYVMGVQVLDGGIAPIYYADSSSTNEWTAPCGSLVIINTGFDIGYDLVNASAVNEPPVNLAPNGFSDEYIHNAKVFRVDAEPGGTATIDVYENW